MCIRDSLYFVNKIIAFNDHVFIFVLKTSCHLILVAAKRYDQITDGEEESVTLPKHVYAYVIVLTRLTSFSSDVYVLWKIEKLSGV